MSEIMETINNCNSQTLQNAFMISASQLGTLVRKGYVKKIDRGLYDLPASIQGYVRYMTESIPGDLTQERIRLTKAQADAKEIENAKIKGELLHVDDVEKEWSRALVDVRSRFLSLPSRAATLLQGVEKAIETKKILDELVRDVLQDLSEK